MSGRGVVVAGVDVEAPLALRLPLVFPVAVAEARHHKRQREPDCTPHVQLFTVCPACVLPPSR